VCDQFKRNQWQICGICWFQTGSCHDSCHCMRTTSSMLSWWNILLSFRLCDCNLQKITSDGVFVPIMLAGALPLSLGGSVDRCPHIRQHDRLTEHHQRSVDQLSLTCLCLGGGAWTSGTTDMFQFLGVDLGYRQVIKGVETQGRRGSREYVSEYYVWFSSDNNTWTVYTNQYGTPLVGRCQYYLHIISFPLIVVN